MCDLFFVMSKFTKVDKFDYDFGDIQSIGIFDSFDEAKKTLVEKTKEIFSDTYKYVIIEAVESGYMKEDKASWLYEYQDNEYRPISNVVQSFKNFCYH